MDSGADPTATAATDDWPISVYGAAQAPENGNLQCLRCYATFWGSDKDTTLAELRAALDDHRQICKGSAQPAIP